MAKFQVDITYTFRGEFEGEDEEEALDAAREEANPFGDLDEDYYDITELESDEDEVFDDESEEDEYSELTESGNFNVDGEPAELDVEQAESLGDLLKN